MDLKNKDMCLCSENIYLFLNDTNNTCKKLYIYMHVCMYI